MVKKLAHLAVLAVLLALVAGSGLAAHAPAEGTRLPAAASSSVVIAAGNPIEIAVAQFDGFPGVRDVYTATQMAAADYGSIKGFAVQRNEYDAGCNETIGAAAAVTITQNLQNTGVIGPLCSVSTIGAAPVFETAGLVMISPSNTFPDLPAYGPGIFNRVVVNDPGGDDWMESRSSMPSAAAWEAAFEAAEGHDPSYLAIFAYDATRLLLARIEQVSVLSGADLIIDRDLLRAAVRNTSGFASVTGSIDLDVKGDRLAFEQRPVWTDSYAASTLNSRWFWINEDPTHWSLTARPGFLRLTTQNTPGVTNRLLQGLPQDDFEVRTHMYWVPQANFNFAGLVVHLDGDNFLNFGRAYCGFGPPGCTNGDGIYFDFVQGGVMTATNYATAMTMGGDVYLRLARTASTYTGYASPDGTTWTEIGAHTIAFSPAGVGLFAHNNSMTTSPEQNADFEYFLMETSASTLYLPLAMR